MSDKPCGPCPWTSKDSRDKDAISTPEIQKAMEEGHWFACHVNMGTCHGARLRHEHHLKQGLSLEPGLGKTADGHS